MRVTWRKAVLCLLPAAAILWNGYTLMTRPDFARSRIPAPEEEARTGAEQLSANALGAAAPSSEHGGQKSPAVHHQEGGGTVADEPAPKSTTAVEGRGKEEEEEEEREKKGTLKLDLWTPTSSAGEGEQAEEEELKDAAEETSGTTRGPGIVQLNFMGRLGNNLFEYAAARALADRLGWALSVQPAPYNRKKYGLLTRPEGMKCFPGVRPVGPPPSSPEMATLETVKFRGVRAELEDPTPRSIKMEDWYQSYDLFAWHKDRLRKIMALSPSCCGPTAPGPNDLVIHHRNYRAELTPEQYKTLVFKDVDYEFYQAVLRDTASSAAGSPETVWVVGEFGEDEPLFQSLQKDHGNVKKAGKRAVVVGVANARSIAWGIADRWRKEGAEVFVTYQSERFRKPVEKLLRDSWGPYPAGAPMPATACDITSEEDLAALWRTLQERGFCSSSSSSLSEAAGGSELAGATTNDVQARRGSGGGDGSAEAAKLEQRQRGDVSFNSSSSSNSSSGSGRKYSCTDIDSREGGHVGAVTEGGDRSEATKVPANKTIDVVLHSVAHAPTDAMRQGLIKGTTRDAFVSAHVVSAYSLVSTVRHALPFLSPGASVVALTYIGSQRAATNYNVMGPAKASLESCARALAAELGGQGEGCRNSSGDGAIGPGGVRVNCLSPGPVRTMAARGISGFDEMRREAAERAPLGRGADLEEIAGVATFLASPLSSAVTGQTVYADCGLSAVL